MALEVPYQPSERGAGDPSRREFLHVAGGAAMAAGALGALPDAAAFAASRAEAEIIAPERREADGRQRRRAVSWWLTWDDLAWPNQTLMDGVRRRADACQANDVNCCIIFGAHFRWDFMPLWDRLHDLLRYVGDQLRERRIELFDHHSSVLVHRPHNQQEALNIWRTNRHHVPFYPSRAAAAQWQFNGSRLDKWRMIDVENGQPAYLPAYNAEQFCMNNAEFQSAYSSYLQRLLKDAAIDGLMSDDGIFYPGWRACRCPSCLARFKREYGHDLPPTSDATFWGRRQSRAFHDWIEMRFRASGDFLAVVKDALPKDFPLLTCCSGSDGQAMPAHGMSYQDFIRSCNVVLLEMVGSTPSIQGGWDDRVPSQLLHLGIAHEARVPCFGLGYGFFPETAFFIWALNKFLGSDCWFSTLKGRLDAAPEQLAALADDAPLVGEGYRWEAAHPGLFVGDVDADTAVFFSRFTRDYYGQIARDYVADYAATCLKLMRADVSFEVVAQIPMYGKIRRLVVSSAACLSADEKTAFDRFLTAGGTLIATGPIGHYDQRADKATPWLSAHGIACELIEPERTSGFPPYEHVSPQAPIAECSVNASSAQLDGAGWLTAPVGRGRLVWRCERASSQGVADALVQLLKSEAAEEATLHGLPPAWRARRYRDGDRLLIHALPSHVTTMLHPTLVNQISAERIVEGVTYQGLTDAIAVSPYHRFSRVTLHSPDLSAPRDAEQNADGRWSVDPAGVSRYLILECCG